MNERDIPAGEFRRHMAEHLDRVRAGETFTITRNGRLTAVVSPPAAEEETRVDD
jgi:prevent-host-death family protein